MQQRAVVRRGESHRPSEPWSSASGDPSSSPGGCRTGKTGWFKNVTRLSRLRLPIRIILGQILTREERCFEILLPFRRPLTWQGTNPRVPDTGPVHRQACRRLPISCGYHVKLSVDRGMSVNNLPEVTLHGVESTTARSGTKHITGRPPPKQKFVSIQNSNVSVFCPFIRVRIVSCRL